MQKNIKHTKSFIGCPEATISSLFEQNWIGMENLYSLDYGFNFTNNYSNWYSDI